MGLEAIGPLHAAYVEVLENESSLQKGTKIVRLTVPVSVTNARESLFVPEAMGTPTGFFNGPMAPFCDIITK